MNVAGRRVAGQLLGKALTRFIPGVGLLLTAYDLYNWVMQQPPAPLATKCNASVAACDAGFFFWAQDAIGATCTPKCPGALTGASRPVQFTVTSTGWVSARHRVIGFGDVRNVKFADYQYAVGTVVRKAPLWARSQWRDQRLKPWEMPMFEPWLDPSIAHPLHPPRAKREPGTDPMRPGRDPYRNPWETPLPTKDPIVFPQPGYPGNPYGPWWKPKPRTRRRVRQPQPRRRRLPMPKPRIPPWMDPFPQPRIPVPLPVSDPPTPFPGVVTAPIVGPAPAPGFGVAPLPPGRMPDWEWTLAPQPQLGSAPRLRPRPPGPAPVRPPPPGMKERKVGMNALGYGWALWLFNFATETRDAVDALVKALPCAVQRKLRVASPVEKIAAIYDHFDSLEVPAALTELFLNHVEDFVIGRAHGAISKGFGSGKNWENYLRSVQASHLFTDQAKAGSKALNRSLDTLAKSLSLPRVQCGRR